MSGVGSGDKLARGANRANFQTTEGGVSEEKWNDIFADYDPEAFKNAPNQSMQRTTSIDGVDASSEAAGIPSVGTGEARTICLDEQGHEDIE